MHLHLDVLLPVILADNTEAEIGAEPFEAIVGSVGREEVQKGERKGGKKIEVNGGEVKRGR